MPYFKHEKHNEVILKFPKVRAHRPMEYWEGVVDALNKVKDSNYCPQEVDRLLKEAKKGCNGR